MADDAVQPGMPPLSPSGPAVDASIRAGSPGTAGDLVNSSRNPPKKKEPEKPAEVKDAFREIIETVVFVIVLVFMLKTFLAEAFVIPTGSMANTLLGDHKDVICDQCGYEYRVNGSQFTQPQQGRRREPVFSSDCPNCGFCTPVLVPPMAGVREERP